MSYRHNPHMGSQVNVNQRIREAMKRTKSGTGVILSRYTYSANPLALLGIQVQVVGAASKAA